MKRALLLLLFAVTTRAETLGVIRGTVFEESERFALPQAEVTLSGGGLTQPRTVVANDYGQFVFIAVPYGDYTITTSVLGFRTLTSQTGPIAAGETIHTKVYVRIDLGCSSGWIDVSRREMNPKFIEPLPAAREVGVCL